MMRRTPSATTGPTLAASAAGSPVGRSDAAARPTAPAATPASAAEGELGSRTLMTRSDEQLVAEMRRGNATAGEVLVRRYHEPLLRYLTRQAGSAIAAEELLQQAWLSVFEHLDQFKYDEQGGMGFKAWVYRIATNKAHDQWRSRGRERNAYEGLRLVTDDVTPDASHRISEREQDQQLRWAIDQLPDVQRQVVLLRYYSEMKFIDIAKMLGCPLNTALGRMHKAAIKLRKLMDQAGSKTSANEQANESK